MLKFLACLALLPYAVGGVVLSAAAVLALLGRLSP